MSKMNWKKTGAVASAAVVAVSGAVASPAVMAFAETNADAQPLAAEALSDAAVAQGGAVAVENVEGELYVFAGNPDGKLGVQRRVHGCGNVFVRVSSRRRGSAREAYQRVRRSYVHGHA